MVNDYVPPVSSGGDSSNHSTDTVSTAASSVDFASRKDSDLAQSLKNQNSQPLDFLQGFSLDMGAATATTNGTAMGFDSGTDSGALNDGPWRMNDTDVKDDVYRDSDKQKPDDIRIDVLRASDKTGPEAVRDDVYRTIDNKPKGVTARETALSKVTNIASNDSTPGQPMDQSPSRLQPNGNHKPGGGGDNTGGGGDHNSSNPKPTPDSELPRSTAPEPSRQRHPRDQKRPSVVRV